MRHGATVCISLLMLVAGGSGCAAPRGVPPPASTPQLLQARTSAQQEFGLLAAGDWAGAWERWTDAAKEALSEDDFIRLDTACPPALGVSRVVGSATRIDPVTVVVTWRAGTGAGESVGQDTMTYQDGAWRFTPDDATLAGYRLGVGALVAKLTAAGACGRRAATAPAPAPPRP